MDCVERPTEGRYTKTAANIGQKYERSDLWEEREERGGLYSVIIDPHGNINGW
jgi:hypothetical protein